MNTLEYLNVLTLDTVVHIFNNLFSPLIFDIHKNLEHKQSSLKNSMNKISSCSYSKGEIQTPKYEIKKKKIR